MKVYVSGPMTGLPDLGFGALKSMTSALRAAGFEVVCPTETPKPVRRDGQEPLHSDWMRASLRRLMECDASVFLPGWINSDGCLWEHSASEAIGLPLVFDKYGAEYVIEALRGCVTGEMPSYCSGTMGQPDRIDVGRAP